MARPRLVLDIRGMPEVLADVQLYVAKVLREEADKESDPRVQRKLREIAARVETGA